MDASLRNDMLAQVIDAHVHQLTGIQCAAPQLGAGCRVGGNTLEFEQNVVGAKAFLAIPAVVELCGMPRKLNVAVLKKPVAHHKGLGTAAFLGGAAVVANRTG